MKVRKKTNLILHLTLMGCLFLSRTASGFIPTVHPHQFPNVNISVQEALKSKDLLIHKVHEPSWKIGYRFSTKCPSEYREKSAEFEEMIATVLREWLQPLRDMQLPRPITDDFQFSVKADFHFDKRGRSGCATFSRPAHNVFVSGRILISVCFRYHP